MIDINTYTCENTRPLIREISPLGLCKERKPKRPNPETTETGNSRLISRNE